MNVLISNSIGKNIYFFSLEELLKNLLVALSVVLMSVPALAQHRPHRRPMPGPGHYRPRPMPGPGHYRPRPMPRPMPTRLCSVVMVNRANRVINRYTGYADYRSGVCHQAMQNCRFDLSRRGAWGNRCVQNRF